ncbi:hypothetical protein ACODT5_22850 [Streptomyces sp. 5.8]|uniref:hypothetical protein n=1 Tax=Streptomyces sp. 5.8 TaxID=3406571 RepID=UPI003BB5E29F
MDVTAEARGAGRTGWRGRELLRPLIRPAGVGAVLGGLWLLVAVLPWDFDDFCRGEGWGCLEFMLMVTTTAPVVTTLLGWLLLRLAGVRPAWRVAAVGAPLGALAVVLPARAGASGLEISFAAPLLLAAAYAAAASVALPGVGSRRRWAALAGVLVLLWPLTGALGDRRVAAEREQLFVSAAVPLLAPELEGYRVHFAHVDEFSGTFGYLILPSSVPIGADDRYQRGIQVTVGRQLPGFAPPDACQVLTGSAYEGTGRCEQVAPETWRSTSYTSVRYIARRQGVIVVLTGGGATVGDSDLQAIVRSLAVRRTGFFLDG